MKGMKVLLFSIFSTLFFLISNAYAEIDPIAVYLTWQRQPESTMTVCWITNLDNEVDVVEFQRKGQKDWKSAVGKHARMPDQYPFWIHSVELTNLQADTEYHFRVSSEGVKYKFRTISLDKSKPIRFIVGGDVYHDGLDILQKMNFQAAKLDPLFAIVGGDIAYNNRKPSALPHLMPRWLEWLIAWKNQMIAPDGRLIPLIPAIGNHDLKIGVNNRKPSDSPFFYSLFPFPGPEGFNVLDFGNLMSLIILDSNHTNPVVGAQTLWLEDILKQREVVSHKFAVYHVGAYPSVRDYIGKTNVEIRKNWVPLFEKFGVNAVFEHHDHAYKRTWPISKGKVNFKEGILYLGDGAWGVEHPRIPKKAEKRWYLAKTLSSRHVIFANIHENEQHFMAIDDTGKIIDEVMTKTVKLP
jgi:acid phosphatase type 7